MRTYLNLLADILAHGETRGDRTGTGTIGIFGYQWRHNMADGFPLLTTKKIHIKSVVHELLWFLRGDTNVRYLQENGVTIWNEWADPKTGELGPVYGKQWRDWGGFNYESGHGYGPSHRGGIDQITDLVRGILDNPFSRRHIVSAWNPEDVPKMALPPCHTLWQCYVSADGERLSLHLYARSIDSFLGLPFNIASYGLLLEILANRTGKRPGDLIISFGDLHIYRNHLSQVEEQLGRVPRDLPTLKITRQITSIDRLRFEDFEFTGYDPMPAIKAPIAV